MSRFKSNCFLKNPNRKQKEEPEEILAWTRRWHNPASLKAQRETMEGTNDERQDFHDNYVDGRISESDVLLGLKSLVSAKGP
jgi:hypothetical protein